MGKRGPAPKPTKLKLLQGNPGKRKINKLEPKPAVEAELPKPPAFLSRYAKTEWKRIVPELFQLGLLTKVDYMALAAYCQNYHRWIEAEKKIRATGELSYETAKGNLVQIPEVGIANQAMKLMRDFAKEFGMTPSSRTSLHIQEPELQQDPLAEFLSGGKKSG